MERIDIIEEARRNEMASKVVDHDNRITSLEKTTELILEIHTALIGNYQQPGLIREIKEHSQFIGECKQRHAENKKERIDWQKWTERGMIAATLTWLVAKVGIK
jgi:hypothetical protein